MKLLLDTHTFLWWDSEPEKLSRRALELCQNPENTLVLSVASIWEMQIKIQLGKLQIKIPLEEMISQQQKNGIEILPVEASHIFAVESLPNHHKDPFDRLIIAQAIVEDAILISADPLISQYPVGVEW
ncbi:type II toxin-antitoxin system VapC family toxin [Candidatus Villigracilis affinis]|uniref:type II toxin-antitoxin system VapC family toxin n=1 Tax=Candidatus Villigracilis affinis TaxID=3140682 RepID=UPI002A1CC263|nr:type II toxin-antitoxin system VapC family toxin [Anaerolineales bacterium]